MRRSSALFAAVALLAAASPSLADMVGYSFRSPAGPEVSFIPSFASGYPEIPAPAVEVDPGLLAITEDSARMTYVPEPLGSADRPAGWSRPSPAGPQIAFVPADEGAPQPLWLSNAAQLSGDQLGAVPEDGPAAD